MNGRPTEAELYAFMRRVRAAVNPMAGSMSESAFFLLLAQELNDAFHIRKREVRDEAV